MAINNMNESGDDNSDKSPYDRMSSDNNDGSVFDAASLKRKRGNNAQSQADVQENIKKARKPNTQASVTPTLSDDDLEEVRRQRTNRPMNNAAVSRLVTRRLLWDTLSESSTTLLSTVGTPNAQGNKQTSLNQQVTGTVSIRFNMNELNLQAKRLGIAATADIIGEIAADGKLRVLDYYNKNGTIAEVSIPKLDCLPDAILTKIYRLLFVRNAPVTFDGESDLRRSAGLLRVCRKFHDIGTAVLYGENAFHLARRFGRRGAYWENPWQEIGFKDIRQFIVDVGPQNVKKMKYISILLDDSAPSMTPHLSEDQRRFVNDEALLQVLEVIGSNSLLEKFAIALNNRKAVDSHCTNFLKHLSSIKCHEFRVVLIASRANRLAVGIEDQLRASMVVPRPSYVDVSLKKMIPEMTY